MLARNVKGIGELGVTDALGALEMAIGNVPDPFVLAWLFSFLPKG